MCKDRCREKVQGFMFRQIEVHAHALIVEQSNDATGLTD